MLLQGKKIIVTGGVTGIGKATVLGMAREGAQVVSVSRTAPDDERATTVIEAASALGTEPIRHLKLDITDQQAVNSVFAEAIDCMGGLDVLVNSAGQEHQGPAEDLTEETLYEQFKVHVMGTAFTNAAAFRHFKGVGGGTIVNFASYAGVCGMPYMAAYSAAKGAVLAYTRSVAKDWAAHRVRVNVVCPVVMTELAQSWYDEMDDERRAEMEAWFNTKVPFGGQLGDADDAANLTIFLASDMAKFIHGQTIAVDGGLMMSR